MLNKKIRYFFPLSIFCITMLFSCAGNKPADSSENDSTKNVGLEKESRDVNEKIIRKEKSEQRQRLRSSGDKGIAGSGVMGLTAIGGGKAGAPAVHMLSGGQNFSYDQSYKNYDGDIYEDFNTESYDRIYENPFLPVPQNPLSTFSIDVDAASYANIRRYINNSQMPPKDAVRIEEMVNYFSYDYPAPGDEHPFSIYTEMGECPWNKEHKLVHIGLQGKKIETENAPPSNLVFLLDVSGSMNASNKLPLLKKSFKLLVNQLKESDQISIVVYAGAAGLVLPPTSGSKKTEILEALDMLQAGGSTAGGAGIQLAYKIAKDNFIKQGNNRVLLATDGDFNIGASSDAEMVRMIEEKRKDGIFLTVLGFGMGNYKDSKMEKLADKGNGNYAYIDNILEAKKVFINELGSTLFTIAKDVKIQIEFNPVRVSAYRLIGYENRILRSEDFNDDKKDAGELGAGHTVTALYEIVPVGVKLDLPEVDELKYQHAKVYNNPKNSEEWLTVKFRYKNPADTVSNLIAMPLTEEKSHRLSETSENFRFAAAVAGYGMLLRDSKYKGNITTSDIVDMAKNSSGDDKFGYRSEFVKMVEKSQLLLAVAD